jgi:hypothetical protein
MTVDAAEARQNSTFPRRKRLRRARQIQEPPGDQAGETVLERIERDNLLSLRPPAATY